MDGRLEATSTSLNLRLINILIAAADSADLGYNVHAVTNVIVAQVAQAGRELILDEPSCGFIGKVKAA